MTKPIELRVYITDDTAGKLITLKIDMGRNTTDSVAWAVDVAHYIHAERLKGRKILVLDEAKNEYTEMILM